MTQWLLEERHIGHMSFDQQKHSVVTFQEDSFYLRASEGSFPEEPKI